MPDGEHSHLRTPRNMSAWAAMLENSRSPVWFPFYSREKAGNDAAPWMN